MTSHPPARDFLRAIHALPEGAITGQYGSRRYLACKAVFNAGKSVKLEAKELGGTGYVSLNLYLLDTGPRLFPCEMSAARVTAFVLGFVPDQPAA